MKFLPKSSWPNFNKSQILLINRILKSGKVNYHNGNFGKKLEIEFANYIKVNYSICVSSGTTGLEISLNALNLPKKSKVLVPPRTYYTSVSSVIRAGYKPKFVDISLVDQNICISDLEKKIDKSVKAILCVHLAGSPCDMIKIMKLAKKYKLKVIEDCSQAHGSSIGKKKIGSFGDLSIFSFCNDKIISAGEGGIICFNDKKYFSKIWSLKDNGKNYSKVVSPIKKEGFQWFHDTIGTNARLTEIQSALILQQLNSLDKTINQRINNSKVLNSYFKNIKCLKIPVIRKSHKHVFYRYTLIIDFDLIDPKYDQPRIIYALKKINLTVNSGGCPEIYLEDYFKKNYKIKRLKNSKLIGETSISLILDHTIKRENLHKYAKKIANFFIKISLN